jgi:cation-transporting ATPase E
VLREAFPGGLTDLFIILGLQAFAYAFDFSTQSLSTLSALCVAFIGVLVLYQVCKPFDGKRWVLWGSVVVALLFCIVTLGDFFSLSPLNLGEKLVLGVFLILSWVLMRAVLFCFDRAQRLWKRCKSAHGRRRAK